MGYTAYIDMLGQLILHANAFALNNAVILMLDNSLMEWQIAWLVAIGYDDVFLSLLL